MIKFLLKNKGITISGVKNILKSNANKLDVYDGHSLKMSYFKNNIKTKGKLLLEKVNNLKSYGKKNSS